MAIFLSLIAILIIAFVTSIANSLSEVPESEVTNSIGMKLKLIPAGTFMMGSPEDEEGRSEGELLPHSVTIKQPFYVGMTEVTVGQFRQFVEVIGRFGANLSYG